MFFPSARFLTSLLTTLTLAAGSSFAQVELIAEELHVSGEFRAGAKVSLKTVVRLIPAHPLAPIPPVPVHVYVSSDSTITRDDVLIHQFNTPWTNIVVPATQNHTITLPRGLEGGAFWVGIFVDPYEELLELSESNNTIARQVTVFGLPDWQVSNLILPNPVEVGKDIDVEVAIRNAGLDTGPAAPCEIFLSRDNQWDTRDTLATSFTVGPIARGISIHKTVRFKVPANTPEGSFYFILCVNRLATVDELHITGLNRTSRQATSTGAKPDLAATWFGLRDLHINTIRPGDLRETDGEIRNAGGVASTECGYGIYLSADSVIQKTDTLLYRGRLPKIESGDMQSPRMTVRFPEWLKSGRYYLGVLADEDNDIAELVETNNAAIQTVYCELQVADLEPTDLKVSTTQWHDQQVVAFSSIIRNVGNGSSENTESAYYLSRDTEITTEDLLIHAFSTEGLKPNTQAVHGVSAAIPSAPSNGVWYVGVLADSIRKVNELSELNNQRVIEGRFFDGRYDLFGNHCYGTNGWPLLEATSSAIRPYPGTMTTFRLQSGPKSSVCTFYFGASHQMWGNIPLPLDLAVVGGKGCWLHVSPDIQVTMPTDSEGAAVLRLQHANRPELIGFRFFVQVAGWDPGVRSWPLVYTKALHVTLGPAR